MDKPKGNNAKKHLKQKHDKVTEKHLQDDIVNAKYTEENDIVIIKWCDVCDVVNDDEVDD